MARIWFVTGAGRGIGAAIAKAALAAGDQVVATARNPGKIGQEFGTAGDRVLALALDVTSQSQAKDAVKAAVDRFGRIDVLVNNAGYGQLGMFEETAPEAVRAQFDTNVFGLMNVTRAVLPTMRKQRSGYIVNLSSVAGLRGSSGGSVYNASKFAVEGLSQALAEELGPFGIHVTVVSPGFVRTDFLDSSSVKYADSAIPDYAERDAALRAMYDERNHRQSGDPARLAQAIVRLTKADSPPVSFVAGSDAVEWARQAIQRQQAQVDAWRELSVSTDGAR